MTSSPQTSSLLGRANSVPEGLRTGEFRAREASAYSHHQLPSCLHCPGEAATAQGLAPEPAHPKHTPPRSRCPVLFCLKSAVLNTFSYKFCVERVRVIDSAGTSNPLAPPVHVCAIGLRTAPHPPPKPAASGWDTPYT